MDNLRYENLRRANSGTELHYLTFAYNGRIIVEPVTHKIESPDSDYVHISGKLSVNFTLGIGATGTITLYNLKGGTSVFTFYNNSGHIESRIFEIECSIKSFVSASLTLLGIHFGGLMRVCEQS